MIRGNFNLPYLNDIIYGSKFYELDGETRAVGRFEGVVSKIQRSSIFKKNNTFVYEIDFNGRKLLSYLEYINLIHKDSNFDNLINLEKLIYVNDLVELTCESHLSYGCGELSVDVVSSGVCGISYVLSQLFPFGEEKEFEDNLSCEIDRIFNLQLNSGFYFKQLKKKIKNSGLDMSDLSSEQDLKNKYGQVLRDVIKHRFSLKENIFKKRLNFSENRHFTVLDSEVRLTKSNYSY
jgi:hypothetical protein